MASNFKLKEKKPKVDFCRDVYSFNKEDAVYNEMLRALALYYRTVKNSRFRSKSEILMYLIKENIPQMVEEVNKKEGIDLLNAYRKAVYGKQTIKDRFEDILMDAERQELLDKSIEKAMEKAKSGNGFKKSKF